MACLVPGCKSNYCDKVEYIPVFSFPADNETREKWFRAIPRRREDFIAKSFYPKLCYVPFEDIRNLFKSD